LPVLDDAAEYERILADELLHGLPAGEDAHRSLVLRVAEGTDHEQVAPVVEHVEPGPVRREVCGRLAGDVVGRVVEQHVEGHGRERM
jgi:hypothetical protein